MAIPQRLPGETLHRYFGLIHSFYDAHGRCVITFDGQVDADRMARAVRLMLDAEPILGCQFIEHPWRPYWQRRDDLDNVPAFSVCEPHNLDGELEQFMGKPLDPATDALVRTCLFRSDHDTLCIKIKHIVADAGGLLQYIHGLASIYRQLGENLAYVPPWVSVRCSQADVIQQVGLSNLLRALRHFSLPPAAWGKKIPFQGLPRRKFVIRRIGPERVAMLKAYAHRCKIPLNHILLTAYFRALFTVNDPPMGVPLATQVTVNLRRYLKPDSSNSVNNLVGAFFPTVIRKPHDRFESTLAQVHQRMQVGDQIQPWLGQLLLAEIAFAPPYAMLQCISRRVLTQKMGPPTFPPIYANLGVIDPNQVDFGIPQVTDVAMIGPAENPPTHTLTINTFRETMVFTTSFYDTAEETRHAVCLLDQCILELPE